MLRLLQWIKFQANATPIDVLHSPFVFRLYNKALKKSIKPAGEHFQLPITVSKNQKRICYAVFELLNCKKAAVLTSDTFNSSTDMLIYDAKKDEVQQAKLFLSNMHNDALLVVLNPNLNRSTITHTRDLLQHPKARVVVDVFDMLLIFCRQEQAAQYFRLRV